MENDNYYKALVDATIEMCRALSVGAKKGQDDVRTKEISLAVKEEGATTSVTKADLQMVGAINAGYAAQIIGNQMIEARKTFSESDTPQDLLKQLRFSAERKKSAKENSYESVEPTDDFTN